MKAYDQDCLKIRSASEAECQQMKSYVFWMYERGQPVVLWGQSGLITLLPETVPADSVVLLRKNGQRLLSRPPP